MFGSYFVVISVTLLLQPETIGSLPSLEELWLDCNDLLELPPVSFHHIFPVPSVACDKI